MTNILRIISDKVNAFAKVILTVSATLMVTAVFAQIICRYVFKTPLSWSEELARYLFMWTTFLGASVGLRYNSLPNITLGLKLFPQKIRPYLYLVTHALGILFCYHFVVYGTDLVLQVIPDKSPGLDFTIAWAYAALPLGGLFMFIHSLFLVAEQSEEKLGSAMLGLGISLGIAAVMYFIINLPLPNII
jgi:TRAP-type C4-dicarboxylate transport system permease small subunit